MGNGKSTNKCVNAKLISRIKCEVGENHIICFPFAEHTGTSLTALASQLLGLKLNGRIR